MTILPNVNESVGKAAQFLDISPEEKVLALLRKKEITRRDAEDLLNCSAFPAKKILNSLIKQGKSKSVGNAKATKYVLL